jgi:hypothetical protein
LPDQEEAPSLSVAIDGALDCAEQLWRALRRVERNRAGAAY